MLCMFNHTTYCVLVSMMSRYWLRLLYDLPILGSTGTNLGIPD